MKKYIISENVYKKLKVISEQEEEIIELTPEQYKNLLIMVSGEGDAISNIKKFRGKKIHINSSLDLKNTNVKSLGPIEYINGRLDISDTKVEKLPETLKTTYIWDFGTPLEAKRRAAERRERYQEAQEKREEDEWNLEDGDETGKKAHALLDQLEYQDNIEVKTQEDKDRLVFLNNQLEELENSKNESDGGDDYDEILEKIDEIEEEISEIEEKKDVYDLYESGNHYDLTTFKLLDDDEKEWAVGTESEVEYAAKDYVESLIDDIGYTGFASWVWESNIDTDKIHDEMYDFYYDRIMESPADFDVEYSLSAAQEKKIEELEEQIENLEEQRDLLDDTQEDYQDLYDDFETNIEELKDEIDDIESSPEEIDENEVEKMANNFASDYSSDPKRFFDEFGGDVRNYIEHDSFVQEIIDSDGYGIISGYDNSYDVQTVNGTDYYIFRIN